MSFTLARDRIKRGELARRAGCNIETIRYYETVGLMPQPSRTEAGHRLYSTGDQRRLRFILRCRDLGFLIDEIRSLLSMMDSGAYTCREIYALTQEHLQSISRKIADLKKMQRMLKTVSQKCAAGDEPDCPVIESLVGD